jgi:hypothetical protein
MTILRVVPPFAGCPIPIMNLDQGLTQEIVIQKLYKSKRGVSEYMINHAFHAL